MRLALEIRVALAHQRMLPKLEPQRLISGKYWKIQDYLQSKN